MNSANAIPALAIALRGKALIEASAGTGKTWTLSGILLRLLIEGQREPREIVATTFTRAAAAEMQTRVAQRLTQLRDLLLKLFAAYDQDNAFLDDDGLVVRIDALLDTLAAQTGDEQLAQAASDPINRHLLARAARVGAGDLIDAYTRCALALVDIDKLFIGTLDSLFQRWLRELALESGVAQIEINPEPQALTQLAHDHLRQFYQQQNAQHPELLQRFYGDHSISPDDYAHNTQRVLSYGDAPFLPIADIAFDRHAWQASIDALLRFDAGDAQTLMALLAEGVRHKWLRKNSALTNAYQQLPEVLYQAQQGAILPAHDKLVKGIIAAQDPHSNVFNKGANDDYRTRVSADPLLLALGAFIAQQQGLEDSVARLQAKSVVENAAYVRAHLPRALQEAGETTFDALREQLENVLDGAGGAGLAQYLAQRYPVILVDEAQDLSSEQSALLQRIYFRDDGDGFFLMVGDPKQAIYGYRGSDVANYRQLRGKIDASCHYALETNFRSAHHLIAALNEAYAGQADNALGEDIHYQPMHAQASPERARPLCNRERANIAAPLLWLRAEHAEEALASVLDVVQRLIAPNSQYLRCGADGTLQPIHGHDILILAYSNRTLAKIEALLNTHHIASERHADQNVFTQTMAVELLALMQAMLESQHSAVLRRVLSGPLYAVDAQGLQALAEDAHPQWRWDELRQRFQSAGVIWQQYGLLSALQHILPQENHLGRSVWAQIAAQPAPQSLRDLLDLRVLQQIIADQQKRMRPRQFIDWWRAQLHSPPNHEWALCLPLPGSDAVRLMTMHKAKGLQAPVVIVLAPSPQSFSRSKDRLSVGTLHKNDQLYLSATPKDPAHQAQIRQEAEAEQRRLMYVALTRAEDVLVVIHQQRSIDGIKMLAASADRAQYARALTADTLAHALSGSSAVATPAADKNDAHTPLRESLPAPKRSGWRKTSFSSLARLLSSDDALAVYDDRAFELRAEAHADLNQQVSADLALPFRFARGTEAGSFLHEVLEKIDTQHHSYWTALITRLLSKYHLSDAYGADIDGLQQWLKTIVHSPLAGGLSLAQLGSAEQQRELDFTLALDASKPLPAKAINALFAAWGKPIRLNPDDHQLYGFLRGEIDVLYRHNGRYHILDYKSNHLGNQASDYHPSAMNEAMDAHHYWLQALIYQLALHRLLRTRLRDYDSAQHLGVAEYFFIRAANTADHKLGHLAIDIPADLVHALDKLLS